ncbi:hypothetical protein LPJ66_011970, partial [Kickxella alabastrina]
ARVMLGHVMRKLALQRSRAAWDAKRRGKHGAELRRLERAMAAEEARVHAFCDRLQAERLDAWVHSKAQHEAALARSRAERRAARLQGCAADVAEGSELHCWYAFIRQDPDLAELAREVATRFVAMVPASPLALRSPAEARFLARAAERRPQPMQEWFVRNAHLLTGANHLVKLADAVEPLNHRADARQRELGAKLRELTLVLHELDGVVELPQHV